MSWICRTRSSRKPAEATADVSTPPIPRLCTVTASGPDSANRRGTGHGRPRSNLPQLERSTTRNGWRGPTPAGRADRRPGWPLSRWASDGAWIRRPLDGTAADGLRPDLRVASDAPHCGQPQTDARASRGTDPCADQGIRRTGRTNGRPRDHHAARSQKRTGPGHDRRLSWGQPVGDLATTVSRRPTGHPNFRPSASDVTKEPYGSRQTYGNEDSLRFPRMRGDRPARWTWPPARSSVPRMRGDRPLRSLRTTWRGWVPPHARG